MKAWQAAGLLVLLVIILAPVPGIGKLLAVLLGLLAAVMLMRAAQGPAPRVYTGGGN